MAGLTKFNEFVNFTGLTTLTANAFWGASLSEITLPPNIKYIYSSAFRNATNLRELTIPAAVTNIENAVFFGCGNLTKVIMLRTTPPSIAEASNFSNTRYYYVPAESLDAYKVANTWSAHADHILPIPE